MMVASTRLVIALAGLTVASAAALGQQAAGQPAPRAPQAAVSSGIPQRDTLMRMMRPLSANFQEQRLEDVVKFIAEVTGADLEPMWLDDRNPIGLNKDALITLNLQNRTALVVLEQVLERATDGSSGTGGNTWQMSDIGSMQVGPKERLNKFRRVELYDINDLLIDLPRYNNAPQFDLQSSLQSGSGGGGSSQSPFQNTGGQNDTPRKTPEEKANDVIKILTELIEPEQWQDAAGDGGSIRFFQGTLIVNAPDYMHRQIHGYPYWSARSTKMAMVSGRRYVGFNAETTASQLRDLRNVPVTGP